MKKKFEFFASGQDAWAMLRWRWESKEVDHLHVGRMWNNWMFCESIRNCGDAGAGRDDSGGDGREKVIMTTQR